ncbi:MAG TPA: right-handed parallel beta-helix repeat-containing protein [Clostridiaceae bacterium]|nr:right-handed parallel beta-helix repeat-containing protein [Clostridiaceae bacterium]
MAKGTVYYVDSVNGNDTNNGLSPETPWKTFDPVNKTTFKPGDEILLKCGGVWNEQLYPKGSGTSDLPITISSYGTGSRPVINGGSLSQGAAVYLFNQSYWVIENLEVTNDSGVDNSGTATTPGVPRYGILAENDRPQSGITIRNNYVHNVNGAFNLVGIMDAHINGGITLHAIGPQGKFTDVLIEGNTVENVGRTGIVAWQDRYYDKVETQIDRDFMGTGLIIRNNFVSRLDSDGILVFGFKGSLIEYNVCQSAGLKMIEGFNMNSCAGIWSTRSADTIIQYNESYDCRTNDNIDGQGFDVDVLSDNTIVQYNYSHHNQGGFLLLMGGYNSNVKVRYNVIANEGNKKGIFTFSWGTPQNTEIYNNTIYIGPEDGDVKVINTDGDISTNDYQFRNNLIYNLGSGEYKLPQMNGKVFGTFEHNLFFGNHPATEPADPYKLTADPMLVEPKNFGTGRIEADGLKLKKGSPAIGAGSVIKDNGGLDYWGNVVSETEQPNIGAYNGKGVVVLDSQD